LLSAAGTKVKSHRAIKPKPQLVYSVLVINSGSSSLKFALFRIAESPERMLSGKFERIGLPDSKLTVLDPRTKKEDQRRIGVQNHTACVPELVDLLEKKAGADVFRAIGHRVVHGGMRYRDIQRIDITMLDELRRLSPFDPEHLPSEIALMEAFATRYPDVPQVACFDTAFHRDLPRIARLLPIPRRYEAQGIFRYGFHGSSYAYLMEELERVAGPKAAKGRIILAHLGNGASMAAVRDGKCIDTTMAFTPAAGLVMSTRSGDLDPGLVAYLARTEGMSVEQFHEMVNAKSGLLGVSEISSDIRDLQQQEKTDVRAAEAIALFCYQAKKWLGALAAALGGLDLLVFTGGIGENAPALRARICDGLGFLGIDLDSARNEVNAPIITGANSRTTVRVVRTDEELHIAASVVRLLARQKGESST
jgi:acetate kinase